MAGKEAFDAGLTPTVPGDNARYIGQADAATDLVSTPGQLLQYMSTKGGSVASAATVTLPGFNNYYHITGTTGITDLDFANSWDGRMAWLEFDGSLLLTHNGTSLDLPGGDNIQTQAGDRMCIVVDSGDNIVVLVFVPANRAFVTSRALATDAPANSTVTAAKITGLDLPVGVGIYNFTYWLRYQSAATTTGIKVSVNHTGTVTTFMATTRHINAAATITNAPSQNENLTTAAPWQGHSARAKSTAAGMGPTLSVDAANSDMMMIVEGMMIVTVAGNLELYHASEVAASSTIKAGSQLVLIKTG